MECSPFTTIFNGGETRFGETEYTATMKKSTSSLHKRHDDEPALTWEHGVEVNKR